MEKKAQVKRGAWTKEEDTLLRNCIEKFGEGKWHKVPLRAGLNRCRKSCRLRWMNYLRPNIKRGYFTKDEVDLIQRLHKLLGNRWSLIAGRLPGRTANDVKNFWNTYINGKRMPQLAAEESFREKAITKSNIIRPRPRTFSEGLGPSVMHNTCRDVFTSQSNSTTLCCNNTTVGVMRSKKSKFLSELQVPPSARSESPKLSINPNEQNPKSNNTSSTSSSSENPKNKQPSSPLQEEADECVQWWSNLLEITENGGRTSILFSDEDRATMEPMLVPGFCDPGSDGAIEDGMCSLSSDDIWELIGQDQSG